jgi:S1-C subfamily serine protease
VVTNAYACTECGRCTAQCPANLTGKKLSPRKVIMDVRDRMEEIQKFGLSVDDKGVVVAGLEPGSRAAEAGLQRGDLILEVNRQPVGSPDEFVAALVENGEAGSVLLRIADNGRSRQVNLRWR